MLFSKCLRAKIYCNMNGHFDPQGCQTLLLKESELFFYLWAPGLMDGWMTCDLKFFSIEFQSYQDDESFIMKGRVQWNLVYG